MTHGPSYSYFPKPSKTNLVVKGELQAAGSRIFEATGIQLTEEGDGRSQEAGQRHLGAAVSSAEYVAAYLDHRITSWAEEVDRVSEVAATHPHAAYAGYMFGLPIVGLFCSVPDQGKWLGCDGKHQARQRQQNTHLTMPTSIIEGQG